MGRNSLFKILVWAYFVTCIFSFNLKELIASFEISF